MFSSRSIAILLSVSFLLIILQIDVARAKVECNSTAPGDEEGGVCTGDYCFNIENTIRGCVDFYRMIRDDNIACGRIPIFGDAPVRMCVCTQPYCGKYNAENMPELTLASNVRCTEGSQSGYTCTPGPCYVGTEFVKNTAGAYTKQTCWRDWFGMIPFNEGPIVYEVPPLANHSACFFDDHRYACLCKDRGCNQDVAKPPANAADDDEYFICHKAACSRSGNDTTDERCDESYLGNETCVGQMCYYSNTRYDFKFNSNVRSNEAIIARGCLNYSYANPIEDLTFMTRIQFGSKSQSVFTPCRGDYCNSNGVSSGGMGMATTQISNLMLQLITASLLLLLTLA